jgi:hypothetical protein
MPEKGDFQIPPNATVALRPGEKSVEYWDCTDTPDYENIQRILSYLSRMFEVPGDALTALERLCDLAYPGEKTSFVCRICGDRVTVPRTPGKRPTVLCKKSDCRKIANRRRAQRYRARRAQLRHSAHALPLEEKS